MFSETIVAISTALSEQAISVIRISGDRAREILSTLTSKDFSKIPTHTVKYGFIKDPHTHETLDECLVFLMKAPRSYTKEDVAEIHCHGGVYITRRILAAVLSTGARLARPGEFTQRAMLNGRIDLTQAEAIQDMIEADSPQSAAMAVQGIRGSLKRLIEPLMQELLGIIANIEVNIDYPEYDDVEQLTRAMILPLCVQWEKKLETIVHDAYSGKQMKEGVKTVIIGKPNVGKSSLLNALLEEDKAIVTEIPGTTRDLVEGTIRLQNVTLHLIDTAGIRETFDFIEKIGIEKTMKALEEAELILLVLDASREIDTEDQTLLDLTDPQKRLVIYNKTDITSVDQGISVSAMKGEIDALIQAINDRFADHQRVLATGALVNERTIGLASRSLDAMRSALTGLNEGIQLDLVAVDLQESFLRLSEILHPVDKDFLLNELFSRFCLGK
ncbi:MAG: tRNA uridine-5-carboxymethylaminomethyl(34) synthesis GTPase MnmE [Erysipelotrichaceae bacterium]